MARTWKIFCLTMLCPAFLMAGAEPREDAGKGKSFNSAVLSEDDSTLKCLDADGREVTLRKNPGITITCYTSFASLWVHAGGKLAGMPNTATGKEAPPEQFKDVELIGSFSNPNTEKILSLKPQLVLLSSRVEKQRALKEILDKSDIGCILLNYENYGDFLRLLELFSRLNGMKLEDNKVAWKTVDEVNSTAAKVIPGKGPRFLSLFASGMKTTAETGRANTAYIAEMLGGRNIMAGVNVPGSSINATLGIEKIMAEDPDVIFLTTMGDEKEIAEKMKSEFESDPAWASLKAVKAKRFHFLPNDLFLYKANERYPESFRMMYGILYPEISR